MAATGKETLPFDAAKAEAFAGEFLRTLNAGALCLMTSIGHRTGLLDVMRGLPPATSAEIAHQAGLNERYVREWLGAMTTGGVVEVDPTSTYYQLPAEHAAFLTRAAAADNMAVFAQYIAVMGEVEEEIVECFRNGGGVPYEKFPRFHEVMAEDSGQSVLSSLESHVLPLVPGLTEQLAKGIRVLDLGCGSGRIINQLAQQYPNSVFVGMDLSPQAIGRAQSQARQIGLSNTRFIIRDLSDFHESAEPEAYDFVTTFDAIHDQAKPLNVLKGIHRTLKPDGVYLMQDIRGTSHVHGDLDHPIGPFLYTISTMLLDAEAYRWMAPLIAYGEFVIGVALILGLFTGIAAAMGGFLNWNFMMAGTASTNPILFVLAVLLVLAWKVAGYIGVDRFLLPALGTPWRTRTVEEEAQTLVTRPIQA